MVDRLLKQGRPVVCMVRNESSAASLRESGARLIVGDVTDAARVAHALVDSRAKAVFHLAGQVTARRGREFMRVNRDGVDTVAAACAALVNPPVLVIVSSLAAAGPSAPTSQSTETDAPSPVSQYGRSKLAGEHAAGSYASVVPVTIVRPPVVYGPGDRALLEVFSTISRWGVHFVPGWFGNDERRLSLIHVDDLVDGLLLAERRGGRLAQDGAGGQGVYYLAAADTPSYEALGIAIASSLARGSPAIVRLPGPLLKLIALGADAAALAGRRPGWISRDKVAEALAGAWVCSAVKARAELGWAPTRSLAEGLRDTADWYRRAGWL